MKGTIFTNEGVTRVTPSFNKQHSGLSLLELLIVIAISGIMLTFTVVNYNNWRKRENFRASQREIVSIINDARSQSRRVSRDQTITWDSQNEDVLIINHNGQESRFEDVRFTDLSNNDRTGNLTFTAPFGRRSAVSRERLLIQDTENENRKVLLVIYGVTGKTQIVSCSQGGTDVCS